VRNFISPRAAELLADSTAGVLLTYAEGFGLALLEQLAAGIQLFSYDAHGSAFHYYKVVCRIYSSRLGSGTMLRRADQFFH